MDLSDVYKELHTRIKQIDFSLLWKDFKELRFAIYNEQQCFFDGQYIEKTNQFIANTAVQFNGEYIAIWHVNDDHHDFDVLASKIVHEMFHGFQSDQNETRFANEFEALVKYTYTAANFSMKMIENQWITELIDAFDENRFHQLLQIRKKRMIEHPYEYLYESSIEQIEGSANYVELEALKQLSVEKYQIAMSKNKQMIKNINKQIPIRVISYSIGALLLYILKKHTSINCDHFSNETFAVTMLCNTVYEPLHITINQEVEEVIENYKNQTLEMINLAVSNQNCVLEGNFELTGINVYNARYLNQYIVSTYFVAYKTEEREELMYGDFVIQIDENWFIRKIYVLKKTGA